MRRHANPNMICASGSYMLLFLLQSQKRPTKGLTLQNPGQWSYFASSENTFHWRYSGATGPSSCERVCTEARGKAPDQYGNCQW